MLSLSGHATEGALSLNFNVHSNHLGSVLTRRFWGGAGGPAFQAHNQGTLTLVACRLHFESQGSIICKLICLFIFGKVPEQTF